MEKELVAEALSSLNGMGKELAVLSLLTEESGLATGVLAAKSDGGVVLRLAAENVNDGPETLADGLNTNRGLATFASALVMDSAVLALAGKFTCGVNRLGPLEKVKTEVNGVKLT